MGETPRLVSHAPSFVTCLSKRRGLEYVFKATTQKSEARLANQAATASADECQAVEVPGFRLETEFEYNSDGDLVYTTEVSRSGIRRS